MVTDAPNNLLLPAIQTLLYLGVHEFGLTFCSFLSAVLIERAKKDEFCL
jgi:hypothetical protein